MDLESRRSEGVLWVTVVKVGDLDERYEFLS